MCIFFFFCLFVLFVLNFVRVFVVDGGKVIEAVITRCFTLTSSTIGRATYVHIYVLPPAVWDDRINVTSICWRSSRPLSNDRPQCKQQSIPSIIYDHRDYEWWRICGNNTHPTQTCFGIWRKSSECRQLHQTKTLIWIKRLSTGVSVPMFSFRYTHTHNRLESNRILAQLRVAQQLDDLMHGITLTSDARFI